jgi:hypothetical protein
MKMSTRRSQVQRKSHGRSAVSNGKLLHANAAGIDGRSHNARRFRDLVRAHEASLGGNLSEVDMCLVRTAAALTLRSEQLQADLAAGKDVDSDALIRLASTSRRSLAAVSAKAIANKPATMTLQDHLAMRAAALDLASDSDDEDGD